MQKQIAKQKSEDFNDEKINGYFMYDDGDGVGRSGVFRL